MKKKYSRRGVLSTKFLAAPFILQAYCVFATLATIYLVVYVGLFSSEWRTYMRPFIETSTVSAYGYGMFFIYASIFSNDKRVNKRALRFGMIAPLLMYIVYGLLMLKNDDAPSPSSWTIVWTILIPVAWATLLMSRSVTTFLQDHHKTGLPG